MRRLRLASGLTQEEVAHRADFSRSYYTEIETGKRNVSLLNLHKLAECFGVSLDTLLDLKGEGEDIVPYQYRGKQYRSKKHPLLEYIFDKKTQGGQQGIGENHTFTLKDISDAYRACGIPEPASISNTILDLTRRNTNIQARLPESISSLGYDLRKKTGQDQDGYSYAGEFVYVGIGNTIVSWLIWPPEPDKNVLVRNIVPQEVQSLLGKDEGALFSVIDYCDVLSLAVHGHPQSIIRVQNPMKWQPNEIDGLYVSHHTGREILYPIEAKALSTRDDINLEQMQGALQTILFKRPTSRVIPLGIQMINNGMRIAVFREASAGDDGLEFDQYIQIMFDPPIEAWK